MTSLIALLGQWWQSISVVGGPFMPYFGLALLIIFACLGIALLIYLLIRIGKRLPPMLRYLGSKLNLVARWLWKKLTREKVAAPNVNFGLTKVLLQADATNSFWWSVSRFLPIRAKPLWMLLGADTLGKLALLQSTVLDTNKPFSDTKIGASWWDLGELQVLSVSPSLYANEDRQHLFQNLLKGVVRERPERPLEGLIISLSIEELRQFEQKKEDSLEKLIRVIESICAVTGHRLPLYIVITDTECLGGYTEYVRLVAHSMSGQQDLHWICTQSTIGMDLDRAFKTWGVNIGPKVWWEICAAAPSIKLGERSAALQFPENLAHTKTSLIAWLGRLKEAVEQAPHQPHLQGVYLSGLEQDIVTDNLAPHRVLVDKRMHKLAFVRPGLAQSTPKYRATLVRRAVTSLLFATVLLGMAAVWLPGQVTAYKRNAAVLETISQRQAKTNNPEHNEPAVARQLVGDIARTADASLVSWLVPQSWWDDRQEIQLRYLAQKLQQQYVMPRIRSLRSDVPQLDKSLFEPQHSQSADYVEALSGAIELRRFLDDRELIGQAMRHAEDLPERQTYRALLQFLGLDFTTKWSDELPLDARIPFIVFNELNFSMLPGPAEVRPETRRALGMLWERVVAEAMDFHPLLVELKNIQETVENWQRGNTPTVEQVHEMANAVQIIQREVEGAGARHLLGGMSDFTRYLSGTTTRMTQSTLLSPDQVAEYTARAIQRRQQVRQQLKNFKVLGVGLAIQADDAQPAWATTPDFKRFSSAITSLAGQPFMKTNSVTGRSAMEGLSRRFSPASLAPVRPIIAARSEFLASTLSGFDPTWRLGIAALVQRQSRSAIEDVFMMASAQEPMGEELIRDPLFKPPNEQRYDREDLANLIAAVRLYREAIPLPADYNLNGHVGRLFKSELNTALSRIDARLRREDPYREVIEEVTRWVNEGKPNQTLSYALRINPKERTLQARERIRQSYLTMAEPLIDAMTLLVGNKISGDDWYFWMTLLQSTTNFEQGTPSNAANGIAEFDAYITRLSRMDSSEDCASILMERPVIAYRRDYYSQSTAALDRLVSEACALRAKDHLKRRYLEFAKWFNTSISGRIPFGQSVGANPLTKQGFAQVLARYRALRTRVGVEVSKWPDPVSVFLSQLDALSLRFAGLDTKPLTNEVAEPVVRLQLQLRTNPSEAVLSDQIVDATMTVAAKRYGLRNKELLEWRVGDPIELKVRWALNSDYRPVVSTTGNYQVSDRTVSFHFKGDWALFDLMRRYAYRGDGYSSTTLRLPVNVVGPKGNETALFLMTLMAPGRGPLALDFPTKAPTFDSYSPDRRRSELQPRSDNYQTAEYELAEDGNDNSGQDLESRIEN